MVKKNSRLWNMLASTRIYGFRVTDCHELEYVWSVLWGCPAY